MKKLLLFSCFVFSLIAALNAQVITVTPNPVEGDFQGVVLDGSSDLVPSHVSVTNNTNDTIRLKWQREIPVACPNGWKTQICDNNFCFVASASTNYNPPAVAVPFTLLPGETFHEFLLHVLPGTTAGCCEVKVHFSTTDAPTEILETLTYNVSVNDPECTLSSSTEEHGELHKLRTQPNPTQGLFSISDNSLVKKIELFNLLGKKVKSFQHVNGNDYDISELPNGLYLVSMQESNGNVLKTVRLTKQSLKP